jgi:protein involved in polysaccharide export with SLBB domain
LIRSETIPRITVVGEVFYPGTYTLESVKTNLSNVLQDAGGLTSYASKESSYVIRDGKTLRIKFKNALRERKNLLLTGDVINVASTLEPIETLGSVANPSVFNYSKGKRSKHYIRMSGGKINRIEKRVVVHLNGSSENIGLFKNPKAYPGDQIILIEKQREQRRTILESLSNFNNILGVITGSLTTLLLISRL